MSEGTHGFEGGDASWGPSICIAEKAMRLGGAPYSLLPLYRKSFEITRYSQNVRCVFAFTGERVLFLCNVYTRSIDSGSWSPRSQVLSKGKPIVAFVQ